MPEIKKLSAIFAKSLDADTHYNYPRAGVMYRTSHCGIMNSVDHWSLQMSEDQKNNIMPFGPMRAARSLIVTADREGITLSKQGALPVFVAFPKRTRDQFEVEATGHHINDWLTEHVGPGTRLVCVYKNQTAENLAVVHKPDGQVLRVA